MDYFVSKGDFYDLNNPCPVSFKETNASNFERLFILKLRQYSNDLREVEKYLNYQCKQNFRNKLDAFQKFVGLANLQYQGMVDEKIIKVMQDWFLTEQGNREEKQARKSKKKITETVDSISVDIPVSQENITLEIKEVISDESISAPSYDDKLVSVSEESKTELDTVNITSSDVEHKSNEVVVPNEYTVIKGNFSEEEILTFFSFLYIEKDAEGKTFLTENEVKEIFKYGLAIPPSPLTKKYKLQCSLKFPKSIIEFAIYSFYSKHTSNRHKQDILKFFASYIQDFEKALENEISLQQWSNNVKSARPSRMKFAIADYLPERYK